MQRYFIDEQCIKNDLIYIDDYNYKHMAKVMRYKNHDQVVCILPNHLTYLYEIIDIEKGVLKQVSKIDEDHELDVDVTLVFHEMFILSPNFMINLVIRS